MFYYLFYLVCVLCLCLCVHVFLCYLCKSRHVHVIECICEEENFQKMALSFHHIHPRDEARAIGHAHPHTPQHSIPYYLESSLQSILLHVFTITRMITFSLLILP